MVRLPAIALLFAVITLCAWVEAASAQSARARQLAAHRSVPATGQAVLRKKPPIARVPMQGEKSWMDHASATSSSGGSGM